MYCTCALLRFSSFLVNAMQLVQKSFFARVLIEPWANRIAFANVRARKPRFLRRTNEHVHAGAGKVPAEFCCWHQCAQNDDAGTTPVLFFVRAQTVGGSAWEESPNGVGFGHVAASAAVASGMRSSPLRSLGRSVSRSVARVRGHALFRDIRPFNCELKVSNSRWSSTGARRLDSSRSRSGSIPDSLCQSLVPCSIRDIREVADSGTDKKRRCRFHEGQARHPAAAVVHPKSFAAVSCLVAQWLRYECPE